MKYHDKHRRARIDVENGEPPSQQRVQPSEYKYDLWEAMPARDRFILVFSLIFVLVLIAFSGSIEKPAEFIIQICLAVFVALVALNQYHISKRQWHAMNEGLARTDALAEMTERHFRMVERPVIVVESACLAPEFAPDIPLHVNIVIRNEGRTTAAHILISLELAVGYPVIGYPQDLKQQSRRIIAALGPARSTKLIADPGKAITLNKDAYEELSKGGPMIIHGQGQYFDLNDTWYPIEPYSFWFVPGEGFIDDPGVIVASNAPPDQNSN